MNVRRILILSLTALVAAGAGYTLLGLRAPKTTTASRISSYQGASQGTIIAVGPDGTLYTLAVPAGPGDGYGTANGYATTVPQGYGYAAPTEREEYDDGYGYRHE